jgi:aminopeptidase N
LLNSNFLNKFFSVNQYIGHNVSLKTWDDFWFKESLAIYLAYELNSQISQLPIEDMKIKGEIIDVIKIK